MNALKSKAKINAADVCMGTRQWQGQREKRERERERDTCS